MATNYKYRINVPRLRRTLFGYKCHKIPALAEGDFKAISIQNTRGEELGHTVVTVVKSSTLGGNKRGAMGMWKGTGKHRMFIKCPFCFSAIPAGRLGQHVAYKHPEV